MPGISNFSKEALADRLFAAVKAEADDVRMLKAALEKIAEWEELANKEDNDIAQECVSTAKYALKQLDENE